jgi:quercetin dioxygenase-like cupin family protein
MPISSSVRSSRVPLAVAPLALLSALLLALVPAPPALAAAGSRLIAAGEGDAVSLPNGFRAVHKVGELSTGSTQVFVAEGSIPPGMSTGRHLHEIDEEIVYVLEGELTVVLGEQTVTAGPGDTVFVAAGTWMELSNQSSSAARAVLVIPRAEAERCFRVLHGVRVDEMSESEQREALASCRLQQAAPPESPGG